MRLFITSLCLLFFVWLLGCGSPADQLIKEQIKMTNEWADRLENGKPIDPSEATAMQARAMEIAKKQKELHLSPEETMQVERKYMPEIQRATARLMTAYQKMTGKPLPMIPGMPGGTSGPTLPEATKPGGKEKDTSEGPKAADQNPPER